MPKNYRPTFSRNLIPMVIRLPSNRKELILFLKLDRFKIFGQVEDRDKVCEIKKLHRDFYVLTSGNPELCHDN